MYLSEEILKKEYHNPAKQLEDLLDNLLNEISISYMSNSLNETEMLKTVGILNTFCAKNNFKQIKISHTAPKKGDHCYEMIKNYQSEFLTESTDLYSEYFSSYKYEFKPEKLEEIKNLVLELKTDIKKEHTLSEEEKDDIISIIDEVDKSLIAKTNDIDTVNGKLFRLKMTLNKFNVVSTKVNDKINTIFSKINDINTFITNVQSIYNKADGLITNLTTLLGGG